MQVDRRGTLWDWPVGVALAGLVIVLATGKTFGVVLFWFGVIALLLRRGSFSPRRRD